MFVGNSVVKHDHHYTGIQSLRGIGALLVVFFHITILVRDRITPSASTFDIGAGGVDLFFVISGFIMVIATANFWRQPNQAKGFLIRRIIRIVPLYWLATTGKLVLLLIMPSLAQHTTLDVWHTVSSYLFIPTWNAEHLPYPLLTVGWTLHFEMLFYLLFAAALAMRVSPLPTLTVLLAVMTMAGLFLPLPDDAVWTLLDPMLMEFVAGMWVGYLVLNKHLLSFRTASIACVLAIVAFALTGFPALETTITYRTLFWGVPAALLVYGVASLERHSSFWSHRWLCKLGDASYAIYLLHGFVLPPIGMILGKLALGYEISLCVALVAGSVGSIIAGIIAHDRVEAPTIRYLRKRLLPVRPTGEHIVGVGAPVSSRSS